MTSAARSGVRSGVGGCDERSEEHPRAERERFVPAAGPCYHGERSETAVAGDLDVRKGALFIRGLQLTAKVRNDVETGFRT